MAQNLVLVRHGQSEWNARNVWTGLTDIGLTQKGQDEARIAATLVSDIFFDHAFTSTLSRAKDTLRIMLTELNQLSVPVREHPALNERNYGVYTGKNKDEIRNKLGDVEFLKLRRSWDYPIHQGESLKQVYARVIPYYESTILPLLTSGKKVLVVAHGNSLRALIKYLDQIADADITKVELQTGEIILYTVDVAGVVIGREKRVEKDGASKS